MTNLFVISATSVLVLALSAERAQGRTRVTFRADGTCLVNGEPFFPIGCWVYGLNPDVMADLREHRVNTIVGVGFEPSDLPLIERGGMMCVPRGSDAWLNAAKGSDSLLAWYLLDEPEEHGVKPEDALAQYRALKAKDADHPIGITHDMLIGPERYKGASDFTMTDVYPVTAKRDWPLTAVGRYTANPRSVNGAGWPNFTFIQTFGGPDTDHGKWAQPLPHEVRFMAFNALVHRANGILYFSYWPRAPITWASVAELNRDIDRLVPWLLAEGEERSARANVEGVEVRAKRVGSTSWMIIVTNGSMKPCAARIEVEGLANALLRMPFEAGRTLHAQGGGWTERLAAHDVKVYLAGDEPVSDKVSTRSNVGQN